MLKNLNKIIAGVASIALCCVTVFAVEMGTLSYEYFPGNVGIGTTAPDTLLHIKNNGAAHFKIEDTSSSAAKLVLKNAQGEWDIKNQSEGNFIISDSVLGSVFSINGTSGDVAIIGSTTVDNLDITSISADQILYSDGTDVLGNDKLKFNGSIVNINASGYWNIPAGGDIQIETPANAYTLSIQNNGNVGIGGTPTETFHVFGKIKATGAGKKLIHEHDSNQSNTYFATLFAGTSLSLFQYPQGKKFGIQAAWGQGDSGNTQYNQMSFGSTRNTMFGDMAAIQTDPGERVVITDGNLWMDEDDSKIILGAEKDILIDYDSGNDNFEINTTNNTDIAFLPGGVGNVGIGTTAPTSKLQVQASNTDSVVTMTATDTESTFATSGSITINVGDYIVPDTTTIQARAVTVEGTGTSFTVSPAFSANVSAQTFKIYHPVTNLTATAGTSRLFVQGGTGNVGIGTMAPTMPLHIYSSSKYDAATATANLVLEVPDVSGGSGILFTRTDHGAQWGIVGETSGGGSYFKIQSGTNDAFVIHGAVWNEPTVGIGDSTPDGMLEVSASSTSQDLFMLSSDDGNDGDLFIVKNSGYVGIGTTSPTEQLHLDGSLGSGMQFTRTTHGTDQTLGYILFGNVDLDKTLIALIGSEDGATGTAGKFQIQTQAAGGSLATAMTVASDGNVGIGTTSPSSILAIDKGTGWGQITSDGSSGGCLMLRDTDDAGWTECSVLDGTMSCSTDDDGVCDGS